jgi:hypothetical protein
VAQRIVVIVVDKGHAGTQAAGVDSKHALLARSLLRCVIATHTVTGASRCDLQRDLQLIHDNKARCVAAVEPHLALQHQLASVPADQLASLDTALACEQPIGNGITTAADDRVVAAEQPPDGCRNPCLLQLAQRFQQLLPMRWSPRSAKPRELALQRG